MVRQIPDTEGKEEEQVVVSSIFQALTLEDFDTTDSEEEDVVKRKRTKEWLRDITKENDRVPQERPREAESPRSASKESISIPVEQAEDQVCQGWIQPDTIAPGVNHEMGNSATVRKFTQWDNRLDPEGIEESLAKVNFKVMSKTRTAYWKEYCDKRKDNDTIEYDKWYLELLKQLKECNCYGFNPKCWAGAEKAWNYHTEECDDCREWEKRKCKVKGHSRKSKNSTLSDISLRQHIPGKIRTSLSGKTCCEMNLCTHEFYEHREHEIGFFLGVGTVSDDSSVGNYSTSTSRLARYCHG